MGLKHRGNILCAGNDAFEGGLNHVFTNHNSYNAFLGCHCGRHPGPMGKEASQKDMMPGTGTWLFTLFSPSSPRPQDRRISPEVPTDAAPAPVVSL